MFRIYSAGYTTSRCDIKIDFSQNDKRELLHTVRVGRKGNRGEGKGENITYLRIICVALVGARRARNKNKNENENERTYEK